jgi:hypothetical protein
MSDGARYICMGIPTSGFDLIIGTLLYRLFGFPIDVNLQPSDHRGRGAIASSIAIAIAFAFAFAA